jgi:hypothetical protein
MNLENTKQSERSHILYDTIYIKCLEKSSPRLMVARGWGEGE